MKRSSLLKFGLSLLSAAIVLGNPLSVSAQLSPQVGLSSIVVSPLNSFDPDSPIYNPQYPIPITLRHTFATVIGPTVTHYRFSRFSDFRDATWLPYTPAPIAQIPRSWFQLPNPSDSSRLQVTLHFQVRGRNPNAGRPISFTTDPLTGLRTVKIAPEFLNSNTRSKTILVMFFS